MGFSRSTVVQGLSEVPAENRPTAREATIAHWTFDTMVGIATVLLLLALWYGLAWLRRRDLPRSRWFYRCAAVAGIASLPDRAPAWLREEAPASQQESCLIGLSRPLPCQAGLGSQPVGERLHTHRRQGVRPALPTRLTVYGRVELLRRVVQDRRPVTHVVKELNVSRGDRYERLAQWRAEDAAGLVDRRSGRIGCRG
jgi:hypothetical protein